MLFSAGTVKSLAGFLQYDVERLIAAIRSKIGITSLEQFVMYCPLRPVRGNGNRVAYEFDRAANIDMGAGPPDAEQRFQIETSLRIAAIEIGLQMVSVPDA